MPQFHQMMGDRLRSAEQGADTVVWLALSKAAARQPSGLFFQGMKPDRYLHKIPQPISFYVVLLQLPCMTERFTTKCIHCHYLVFVDWRHICIPDRKPVPAHLPLAWTHSSTEEIQRFMADLETLAKAAQSRPDTQPNGSLVSPRAWAQPEHPYRTLWDLNKCYKIF